MVNKLHGTYQIIMVLQFHKITILFAKEILYLYSIVIQGRTECIPVARYLHGNFMYFKEYHGTCPYNTFAISMVHV